MFNVRRSLTALMILMAGVIVSALSLDCNQLAIFECPEANGTAGVRA